MVKLLVLFALSIFSLTTASADSPSVAVVKLEGVINPVSSDYIERSLTRAVKEKKDAVLIELNTPGGLLDATRSMITAMINADIPVIVYVAPRGARATSAGLFITMGADVAAMAPDTHIGAAHPVNIGGDEVKKSTGSVMEEKAVSDAAAYIRTLANERKRNATWAEKAVRDSVSLTSDEAVKQNVVDLVATNRDELFEKLDGRVIVKQQKSHTLRLKGAIAENYQMTLLQRVLQKIAHPNIAYILMTVGVYGLLYELAAPGIGLGGVAGVICLVLAFFALQILPINTVAAVLIVAGVVMMVLELLNPSHGILMFGGLIAFGIGSFFLIDTDITPAYGRISIEIIAGTMLSTALFIGVALRKTMAARHKKPQTGIESMIGMIGRAEEELKPTGMVSLHGELWSAEATDVIPTGSSVVVTRVEGNKLFVKKQEAL